MSITVRKTKSGFTITAKGRKSGVDLRKFVEGWGESGAQAAADGPALAASIPATRITETNKGNENV